MNSGITVIATIADTEIEAIERQVEERLAERLQLEAATPWMNLQTAASYLDWPQKRLYNLVSAREIPHRKQGNRLLFHRGELDSWLNDHYQGPSEFGPTNS